MNPVIPNPGYNKQMWSVPKLFVITEFNCISKVYTIINRFFFKPIGILNGEHWKFLRLDLDAFVLTFLCKF